MKKCARPCKFRSSTPNVNGCDYMYLTREMRGCPPGEACTRFEEGERAADKYDPSRIPPPNAEKEYETNLYIKNRIYNAMETRRKIFG